MKNFIEAGRKAVEERNFYAALALALSMPDICGSIETPDERNGARYKRWAEAWIVPRYTITRPAEPKRVVLSADDLWQIRNSIVHSGRGDIDPRRQVELQEVLFFDDTVNSHGNFVTINDRTFLQLNTARFCDDVWRSVEQWEASVKDDAAIIERIGQLVAIQSAGFIDRGVQWN